jgi:hypothetical protein
VGACLSCQSLRRLLALVQRCIIRGFSATLARFMRLSYGSVGISIRHICQRIHQKGPRNKLRKSAVMESSGFLVYYAVSKESQFRQRVPVTKWYRIEPMIRCPPSTNILEFNLDSDAVSKELVPHPTLCYVAHYLRPHLRTPHF